MEFFPVIALLAGLLFSASNRPDVWKRSRWILEPAIEQLLIALIPVIEERLLLLCDVIMYVLLKVKPHACSLLIFIPRSEMRLRNTEHDRTVAAQRAARRPAVAKQVRFLAKRFLLFCKRIARLYTPARHRPCLIIIAVFLSFLTLSIFLGVYFTVHKSYGYTMGDAFTLASFVVSLGAFSLMGFVAWHYPRCRCWDRVGWQATPIELEGMMAREAQD